MPATRNELTIAHQSQRLFGIWCALLRAVLAALWLGLGAQAGAAGLTPTSPSSSSSSELPEPAEAVGVIDFAHGQVQLRDAHRSEKSALVGASVSEGDSIVTGDDGEVHLEMSDGGVLAIRPNSQLTLTRYRAEGASTDSALISLARGSLRAITGWIGRHNRSQYAIKTPTAVIGVRGTDHEPSVILPGDPAGDPGTYDRVHAGSSFIKTQHGSVDIQAGRAAFSPHSQKRGRLAPRLLERIPAHYRRSRHEDRLEARHEKVQERLEQIREERIKRVAERRDKLVAAKQKVSEQRAEKASQQKARTEEREPPARRNAERQAERGERHVERRDQREVRRDQRQEKRQHAGRDGAERRHGQGGRD